MKCSLLLFIPCSKMIWYHAEINILGWEVHLSSYFGGNELGVGPEN